MVILKPIDDFKDVRKKLPVTDQIFIDDLIRSVSGLMPPLAEFPTEWHTIEFCLKEEVNVRFLINTAKNTLYVMFI